MLRRDYFTTPDKKGMRPKGSQATNFSQWRKPGTKNERLAAQKPRIKKDCP